MSYVSLNKYLPELAGKEGRKFSITENNFGLQLGEYVIIEEYCEDLNCDCRRVFLEVISVKSQESIATIAYGWESKSFYAKWFGITEKDKEYNIIVNQMRGPILNDLSKQSVYAPLMLEIISSSILRDSEYIDTLKKHYKLFKKIVNENNKLENI